jgi:hypothetical protein
MRDMVRAHQRELANAARELSESGLTTVQNVDKILDRAAVGVKNSVDLLLESVKNLSEGALDQLVGSDEVQQAKDLVNTYQEALTLVENRLHTLEDIKNRVRELSAEEENEYNVLKKTSSAITQTAKGVTAIGASLENAQKLAKRGDVQENVIRQKAKHMIESVTKNLGSTMTELVTAIGDVVIGSFTAATRHLLQRGFGGSQIAAGAFGAIKTQIAGFQSGALVSSATAAENLGALAGQFGTTKVGQSNQIAANQLGVYGLSSEQSSKLVSTLARVSGFSQNAAKSALEFSRGLSAASGVPVGLTMQDMAENAQLLANAANRIPGALARATIQARQFGVSVGGVEGIANRLTGDFEGALESQAELQTIMPGLDFTRLNLASEFGSTADVEKELKRLFSGIDIGKQPRSIRQLIERAMPSLSEQELVNLGNKTAPGAKITAGPAATYSDATQTAETALLGFATSVKVSTAAILAFSAAMISVGGLGGIGSLLRSGLSRVVGGGAAAIGGEAVAGGAGLLGAARTIGGTALGAVSGGLTAGLVARHFGQTGIGAGLGGAIGGALGQAFIPIPIVGAMIGTALGGLAGGGIESLISGKHETPDANTPDGSQQAPVAVDTTKLERKVDELIALMRSGGIAVYLDSKKVSESLVNAHRYS